MTAGAVARGDGHEGGVKVQELGESDPQWEQIQEVVKEQLERAGIKAEGRPECEHTYFKYYPSVCVFYAVSSSPQLCFWLGFFLTNPWLSVSERLLITYTLECWCIW